MMLYQNVIDEFIDITKEIIGEQLTGIYLHGSLAMGCFNPEKSDIDLIVIIEENISDTQKMEFMKRIIILNHQAPKKGLEISIVKRKYCKPFLHPTPFELHFSPVHLQWFHDDPQNYVENMKGQDKDLAAHFTIINQYGITLYGEKIENVFAEVPKNEYIDSIWEDVQNATEDITKQPMYIILNLCRILAFLKDGLYLSKQEGGKWAIEHLSSCYSYIISSAMECYGSNRNMIIEEKEAQKFAKEMLDAIKEEMN